MPEISTNNPSDSAAKNIQAIIEAQTEAQKSQLDLKKSIMLKQIGDKMDLQQQAKEQIQKQNISFNMPGIGGDASEPTGGTAPGISPASGVATGATPAAVGSQPTLQGQPQTNPMASVMNPGQTPQPQTQPTPNPTPMLNSAAQRPNSPALAGIVPPAGVNIPSPIGKPLPPPQGKIIMGQDGKPALNPNFASPDNKTYSNIYNKWRSGQPLTSGESQWVKNKFNNDQNGQPIKTPAVTGKATDGTATTAAPTIQPTMDNYDKVRTMLESKLHMPSGSMWFNPSSNDDAGGWEINPIVKSRIEKEQAAQASHDVRQPDIDFQQADQLDKMVNPTVAPTRSVLGLIGQTTVRAQRAIDQLSNPPNGKITPQMLSGIGSDMAGILQGGAPTQIGMSEQQYKTMTSVLAGGVQFLTQNPQNALPPAISKQLLDSFNQLNDTGKKYIQNNIKSAEILHKGWVSRNQDTWNDLKDNINKQYGLDNGQNSANGNNGGMVTMTSPDGKQYSFSANQADQARQNGWK